MTAPDRIWVDRTIGDEGRHGSSAWPDREDARDVECLRRDPGKWYSHETCARAVQFYEALVKAGVIPAPQKEEK